MNPIDKVFTRVARSLGIYPHDGKEIIFIQDGELCRGSVVYSRALTGHTPLSEIDGTTRVKIRNEVADALGVSHANVQRRLARGEQVMYRQRGELK